VVWRLKLGRGTEGCKYGDNVEKWPINSQLPSSVNHITEDNYSSHAAEVKNMVTEMCTLHYKGQQWQLAKHTHTFHALTSVCTCTLPCDCMSAGYYWSTRIQFKTNILHTTTAGKATTYFYHIHITLCDSFYLFITKVISLWDAIWPTAIVPFG